MRAVRLLGSQENIRHALAAVCVCKAHENVCPHANAAAAGEGKAPRHTCYETGVHTPDVYPQKRNEPVEVYKGRLHPWCVQQFAVKWSAISNTGVRDERSESAEIA